MARVNERSQVLCVTHSCTYKWYEP